VEGIFMQAPLNLAMIIVSIALIAVILLQSRGAGLGGLSGGDYGGSGFHVRRGIERLLFNVTIGLSVFFFALAVLNVILVG
jgi:preprotein translocase subunit SecG